MVLVRRGFRVDVRCDPCRLGAVGTEVSGGKPRGRSPEARVRRAPTVRRVLEYERAQAAKREQSHLIARALRFAAGEWDRFSPDEVAWMRSTAARLERK